MHSVLEGALVQEQPQVPGSMGRYFADLSSCAVWLSRVTRTLRSHFNSPGPGVVTHLSVSCASFIIYFSTIFFLKENNFKNFWYSPQINVCLLTDTHM